jgi:hypothetical protein
MDNDADARGVGEPGLSAFPPVLPERFILKELR